MFEDALMESSHRIKTRSRYWSFLAVLINCSVLIALIVWPLLHPDALPVQIMAALLVAPSPPPPAPLAQATQQRLQVRSELLDNQIQAPSKIPKDIKLDKEVASSPPYYGRCYWCGRDGRWYARRFTERLVQRHRNRPRRGQAIDSPYAEHFVRCNGREPARRRPCRNIRRLQEQRAFRVLLCCRRRSLKTAPFRTSG